MQAEVRRIFIKERSIIVWSSEIVIFKYFKVLADNYAAVRKAIMIKRRMVIYTIKMKSHILYKLKRKGPNYDHR
jgi:hypothetical protein